MGVVLLILKIIGWMILAILAIVIAALFVKIRIVADYGEEKKVSVRWLFLNIPVFPMKKKQKTKKQKKGDTAAVEQQVEPEPVKTEEPAPPAQPQSTDQQPAADVAEIATATNAAQGKPNILNIFMESNGGVEGIILLIQELFSYLGSFFGGTLHAFVVDELMVDMTVTKNDAAQTAIYYGQLCSTVFPMLGAFVTKYKVRKYDFNITPDFLARKSTAEMHISFWFRPARLIGEVLLLVGRLVFKFGFKVAFRMLKPVLQSRKKADNNKANNNTEESGVSNE
ncbi:MAG: DUF2953 domain-containing protein [Clostridia bacterium]|nr:DUF2953 domain-containing protein [Clostridia bacterium]